MSSREISYYSPHNRRMVKVKIIKANQFWNTVLTVIGFDAITLPGRRIVILEFQMRNEALIVHELGHVEQYERLGTRRFLMDYTKGLIKHGYRNHPMELEITKGKEDRNR